MCISINRGKREMLKIKEDKGGHVHVANLKEVCISSVEEGQRVLSKGFKNRQVADTLLNQVRE